MIRLVALVSFLVSFLNYSTNATQSTRESPVCIVGAGPSGLAAAHELESKGYSVVIFERQAEVGGKCQAYYDGPDGTLFHPLGAIVLSNATYVQTLPIAVAAGVTFFPATGITDGWNYPPLSLPIDPYTTVNITPTPAPTSAQIALLQEELARYVAFWQTEFVPFAAIRYTVE
ncbi:hypothetical protein D9758_004555 [Tetrapyrgos nigripes]|uniref:FAD/NAD(P)-binding domain-containing protein n=1 Tax=Tetrapyrgos nigripes TaxID=182062 RepID=A0A8H5H028_9AGAR|nr:hypothetical protein D9758_004555 [Tetrapyrgos nigripes]